MEQFKEVDIIFFRSEMLLEQIVNGSFKHERIVDGDIANSVLLGSQSELGSTTR